MSEEQERIIELRKKGVPWNTIVRQLGYRNMDEVRNKVRGTKEYKELQQLKTGQVQTEVKPKKTSEEFSTIKKYNADGSIGLELKARQRERKVYTNEELIRIHGFNPDEVKLKSATSNEWTTPVNGETYYNYQSKIVVVEKEQEISIEKIMELLEDVPQTTIELICDEIPKEYLLIPLADMHFGLNTKEDYEQLKREIADRIMNGYEEILFTLHGDYFHVDNFKNTTEKGTRIDDVDFEQGIKDGYEFISGLLELALKYSPNVKLAYLKGNHAPSVDYMFMLLLEAKYPQIKFQGEIEEFKHMWLGPHSIFLHHGDKVKSPTKLHQIMTAKFRKEWGDSKSCYLITGHMHHEKSLSFAGVTWYQLQSPSKATSYEKDNGFNTSESGQMLFEFNETKRTAIYYI